MDKTGGVKFFPKGKEAIRILQEIPKGARSLFIEQAVLFFAERSPSINFFFEGITRPQRKRGRKSKQETPTAETARQEAKSPATAAEENDNKMMFNFAGRG